MFNEYIKTQYIKDAEKRFEKIKLVIVPYFNESAPIEEAKGKDISCFSFKDIVDYYKAISTKSVQLLANINSQMKYYTDWCIKEEVTNTHHNYFQEITANVLEQCINKKGLNKGIVTREEMWKLVESPLIRNICDGFLIAALFEGICGREYCELLEVNMDNFKKEKGKYYYVGKDRKFEVSEQLVEIADESAKEFRFYLNDGSERSYQLDDNNCIKKYRANNSKKSEVFFIISKINNARDYLDSDAITRGNLLESGRIDMIKKYMREDELSAAEVISKYRKEIEYRYGVISSITGYCSKYSEALERTAD